MSISKYHPPHASIRFAHFTSLFLKYYPIITLLTVLEKVLCVQRCKLSVRAPWKRKLLSDWQMSTVKLNSRDQAEELCSHQADCHHTDFVFIYCRNYPASATSGVFYTNTEQVWSWQIPDSVIWEWAGTKCLMLLSYRMEMYCINKTLEKTVPILHSDGLCKSLMLTVTSSVTTTHHQNHNKPSHTQNNPHLLQKTDSQ